MKTSRYIHTNTSSHAERYNCVGGSGKKFQESKTRPINVDVIHVLSKTPNIIQGLL